MSEFKFHQSENPNKANPNNIYNNHTIAMMIIASFIKICGYKQTQDHDSQQFIMILGNRAYMKTATQGPSTWPGIS